MQTVTRVITTNPEVIPLNHYGRVGAGIYATGGTISALADRHDTASIIAAVTGGILAYPADALLIAGGIGQTVKVCQYGD